MDQYYGRGNTAKGPLLRSWSDVTWQFSLSWSQTSGANWEGNASTHLRAGGSGADTHDKQDTALCVLDLDQQPPPCATG